MAGIVPREVILGAEGHLLPNSQEEALQWPLAKQSL